MIFANALCEKRQLDPGCQIRGLQINGLRYVKFLGKLSNFSKDIAELPTYICDPDIELQ